MYVWPVRLVGLHAPVTIARAATRGNTVRLSSLEWKRQRTTELNLCQQRAGAASRLMLRLLLDGVGGYVCLMSTCMCMSTAYLRKACLVRHRAWLIA